MIHSVTQFCLELSECHMYYHVSSCIHSECYQTLDCLSARSRFHRPQHGVAGVASLLPPTGPHHPVTPNPGSLLCWKLPRVGNCTPPTPSRPCGERLEGVGSDFGPKSAVVRKRVIYGSDRRHEINKFQDIPANFAVQKSSVPFKPL